MQGRPTGGGGGSHPKNFYFYPLSTNKKHFKINLYEKPCFSIRRIQFNIKKNLIKKPRHQVFYQSRLSYPLKC